MTQLLRVLMLEDNADDALLMARELERTKFQWTMQRVDTEEEFITALTSFKPDVVLSDNALPSFDALGALALVQELRPEARFIVVSGTVGEEVAVGMLRSGVTDYVLKHNLSRLGPVVERALKEAEELRAVERAERATRDANDRFRRAFEDAAIGMALVRPDGRFIRVNHELCDLLGRREESLLGLSIGDLEHPDDAARRAVTGADASSLIGRRKTERRLVHRDGSSVWVQLTVSMMDALDDGESYGVAQFVDITGMQVAQQQLVEQALRDPLTGLPNRALARDRLTAAIGRIERHGNALAVMFLDLDKFKYINDTLGHAAGDALLIAVSERIRTTIRSNDTLARLGGDEFVLLCEDVSGQEYAVALAERVAAALRKPIVIAGSEVIPTASIGIVVATSADVHPDDLIRNADVAMYAAKEKGRGRLAVFDAGMRDELVSLHDTENALRRAVVDNQLRLFFQPQVSLEDGSLIGYEALVRWDHPQRGLLTPDSFMPLAESSGLIVDIGDWVLRTACTIAAADTAAADTVISVNMSARQLEHPAAHSYILAALFESGLDPQRLCIEITESTLLVASPATNAMFASLREAGVRLAIDDFGTGYSSLQYLAQLRPDILKIDKSFVAQLGRDPLATGIVDAVVNLARSQGMSVIAEGIETIEQAHFLREIGCRRAQGFLFARPAPQVLSAVERKSMQGWWADKIDV